MGTEVYRETKDDFQISGLNNQLVALTERVWQAGWLLK